MSTLDSHPVARPVPVTRTAMAWRSAGDATIRETTARGQSPERSEPLRACSRMRHEPGMPWIQGRSATGRACRARPSRRTISTHPRTSAPARIPPNAALPLRRSARRRQHPSLCAPRTTAAALSRAPETPRPARGGAWRCCAATGASGPARRPTGRPAQTLKRKCSTSPSWTRYSLPSRRRRPASRAPDSPRYLM